MGSFDFSKEAAGAFDRVLKERGFRRKHLLWNRQRRSTVEAIQIQRSQTNTELSSRFTLNLGIHPTLLLGERDEFVRPVDCWLETRIGYVTPERTDKWYDYNTAGRPAAEAIAVAARDLPCALSWFDSRRRRVPSLEVLVEAALRTLNLPVRRPARYQEDASGRRYGKS